MITRILDKLVRAKIKDKKAIILYGPRQVGKTTLVNELMGNEDALWLNGDDADTRLLFQDTSISRLKNIIGQKKIVVIDEAQRIENIGISIKTIIDRIKDVKVIATGSTSFDLANKINEPLTGRKWEYQLYPISFEEMTLHHGLLEELRNLEARMLYGYYPEIVTNKGDEKERLKSLADSYLYKDILVWEKIQKPEKLEKLVQALAFQIGSEVSYLELSQICGIDKETIEKYIQILERSFIVFRLNSFSRNIRNELKKSRKIYFYDCGIRNAVINQFSPLELRMDKGALWENFLVAERKKFNHYHQNYCNTYFWRTSAQQEIDYIEEFDGNLHAYEFKWQEKKHHFTSTFVKNYSPQSTKLIHKNNFEEFLQ